MDLKWLAAAVASGRTDAQIAKEMGIPVHQVGYYRRTALSTVRHPGGRNKWEIDSAWLAEQVASGRSDADIAAEKGMTVSAVGQYRRRFKIPPRPRAERAKQAMLKRFPNGRRGELAGNWQGGRMNTGSGYVRIYKPEHPHANHAGYVYEHRLVMEQKLGRLLKREEIVDHIDRNRSNNAPENLRLHATRSQHVKDHFSARDQLTIVLAENVELRLKLREAGRFLENYCDEGPDGEGWKSDELIALVSWIAEKVTT